MKIEMMTLWALTEDGTFLQFAPRFGTSGFLGWGLPPLVILLSFGLLLALYRQEMKLVGRAAGSWLLILRGCVIFLLLGTVLWQPVFTRNHEPNNAGRILVAVDSSGSMNIPDPQRSPTEKTSLARALNLQDQFSGDLLNAQVDNLNRRQIARRLLASQGRDLLNQLAIHHHVELVGFDEMLRPLTLDQLSDWEPSNRGTDLNLPIQHGLKEDNSGNGPLRGILLFSDGKHNRGPDPMILAKQSRQRQIPIHAIGLGCEKPASDLAIVDLQAPFNIFHEAEAQVEARMKAVALPPGDLIVELSIEDKPPRPEHRRIVWHNGADQEYTVPFLVRFEEPGTHQVEVKAKMGSPKVQEANLANNRRARVIRSFDQIMRVLIIDGEARWEYQYLVSALNRDPMVQLDSTLFAQPRLGALTEEQLEKIGNPKRNFPQIKGDNDPLRDYDCIILGDVSSEQLPVGDRRRLEQFVSERGGTLILCAGKRHFPMGYRGPGQDNDPLVKMLPFTEPRLLQPEEGFRIELNAQGWDATFLRMEITPEANKKIWADFPRHYWGLCGKPKPGATSLAFAAHAKTIPSATHRDDLLIRQQYGAGQVLFLGIESTWRWRYQAGDTHHHRFWGQVVRWAAADQLLPAGSKLVRYGPRASQYRPGQTVEVGLGIHPDAGPIPSPLTALARLVPVNAKQPIAETTMTARPGQPRRLDAEFRDLPPGKYRMYVSLPPSLERLLDSTPQRPQPDPGSTLVIQSDQPVESDDYSVDWRLLANLARQSGGEFYTAETVDRLLDHWSAQDYHHRAPELVHPWRDPPAVWWLLGLILGFLTLEWLSRKWVGLA